MEKNVVNLKTINDVLYLYKCQQKPIIIVDRVTLKNEKVENENQNRKIFYKTRLEEYNRRIDKIQKQNVITKVKRMEVNHQKELRVRDRLLNVKEQEHFENMKLLKSIKDKEIKAQKLLNERKYLRSCKNQDGDVKCGKSNRRNNTCVDDQKSFLDSSKSMILQKEEEINDEPLEEANEEECFTDSDQSKLEAINFEKFDYLRVYLERITKFKKHFGSCNVGKYFLEKTAPLWDSLTQCIYRESLILSDMDSKDMIPEAYRKIYDEAYNNATMNEQSRALHTANTWLLETLNIDLDFEISIVDVHKAIAKAKGLVGKSTAAYEIMHLVRFILEHEADVGRNVQYVCNGLFRRTVFEHMKRRTNHRILERSQNTINLLRDKIDSIPTRLLASKVDGEELVEQIILSFITDLPPDVGDDAVSVNAAYANRVRTAMRAFSKTTCSGDGGGSTTTMDCEDKEYEMPRKNYVEKHVDKHMDRLMVFVSKRLASVLSKKSFAPVMDPPDCRLTGNKFLILARKMTKIVFGMDYTREEQIYILDVTMGKIMDEITQRSPRVMYKKKRNTASDDQYGYAL